MERERISVQVSTPLVAFDAVRCPYECCSSSAKTGHLGPLVLDYSHSY